ncbi:unnamed protein product, partial [Ectocarpus sp. 12 AP-2014]
ALLVETLPGEDDARSCSAMRITTSPMHREVLRRRKAPLHYIIMSAGRSWDVGGSIDTPNSRPDAVVKTALRLSAIAVSSGGNHELPHRFYACLVRTLPFR